MLNRPINKVEEKSWKLGWDGIPFFFFSFSFSLLKDKQRPSLQRDVARNYSDGIHGNYFQRNGGVIAILGTVNLSTTLVDN